MASLRKIRLELELDEPTGVYTVTSPDVPGLVTEGSTPQEILANVEEAIECLLEGWAKYGIELPGTGDSTGDYPTTGDKSG
jgi:predicted RNase H-like HicB family nuclease